MHSWDRLRVVIFTCPVCGLHGFSRERLVSHVIDEHSTSSRSPTQRGKWFFFRSRIFRAFSRTQLFDNFLITIILSLANINFLT